MCITCGLIGAGDVNDRQNVCEYRQMKLVPVAKPCIKSETRLVRVWKARCHDDAKFGCFVYEPR